MTLGATTWCICLRFGLVDCDGAATDFGAMQTGDGLLGIAMAASGSPARHRSMMISTFSTCPNWLNTVVSSSAVIRYDRLPT